MRIRRRWLVALAMLALVGMAAAPGRAEEPQKPQKPKDDYYELYQLFADTIDQVERNYVKDISRRELMEAAIKGVLDKLDPYSNYIGPEDLTRFKSNVEAQFGGIGIQIAVERGQLRVLSPLTGTPAYRAGVQAGDLIVEIDGRATDGITLDEAVERLKGEIGSTVKLGLIHRGSGPKEKQTVALTRELIHVPTVLGDRRRANDSWDFMLDPERKIGYIRLIAFSRDTSSELRKAMVELQSEGLKALIIDLRFNPGGLLSSAVDVCDLFVAEGRIVSTQGRNSPERVWEAEKEGTFEGFPMAVLVNRYSASASEIFAACLQDHHRAVIVGERTWGKGSVQNLIDLQDGKSALKLTTAAYRRPSGKNIHRFPESKESDEWGVRPDPDFEVGLDDRQTLDLFRVRRERDIGSARAIKDRDAAGVAPTPDAKPEGEVPRSTEGSDKNGQVGDNGAPDRAVPSSAASEGATPSADKPAGADLQANGAQPVADAKSADPQLRKAVEYLTQELSRPLAANAKSEPKR